VSAGDGLPWLSVTTSEKTKSKGSSYGINVGAVNVGFAAVALESVTGLPDICVHAKVIVSSASGSSDDEPSSVIIEPDGKALSGPAFAIGSKLKVKNTRIVTVAAEDALPWSSVTISEKTRGKGRSPLTIVGDVNVGFIAVALERMTAGPDVWVQA
jgi:hypothetical protein